MTEKDKGTTSSHGLSLSSQEMNQMMGFVCALSMVRIMVYQFETEHLREILSREPNDWDRFVYRAYFISVWLSELWQQWSEDNQKLWETARRDAGMQK